MKLNISELLLSLLLMLFYCFVWMILEYIQYGMVINRLIDNEIMILLYPMFLLSAKYILHKQTK